MSALPTPPHGPVKPGLGYVDAQLTKVVLPTIEFWRKLGITPNGLTTIGLVCSIGALVAVYLVLFKGASVGTGVIAVVLTFLRCYFDYADGLMARTYDMSTKIGGWYDHTVDTCYALVLAVLVGRYNWRLLLILVPLYITTAFNIGCVEKRYNGLKDTSLSAVTQMCPIDSKLETLFRVFDNGVLYLVIAVIVMCVAYSGNSKKVMN
jgi:phosphatidylglycerophosphate synthase